MSSTVFSSTEFLNRTSSVNAPLLSRAPLESFEESLAEVYRALAQSPDLKSVRAAVQGLLPHSSPVLGNLEWSRWLQDWLDSGASGIGELNDLQIKQRMVAVLVLDRLRQFEGGIGLQNQRVLDALTGLPGVSVLENAIELRLRSYQERGTRFAVLFIDVDQFKRVNDQHGHHTGNRLLKKMAHFLRSSFRDTDVVIRYGGDEFVVILDGASGDQAWETSERTRKAIESYDFSNGVTGCALKLTVSIGIAICPEDAATSAAVIEAADLAMYGAKREGSNRSYRMSSTV